MRTGAEIVEALDGRTIQDLTTRQTKAVAKLVGVATFKQALTKADKGEVEESDLMAAILVQLVDGFTPAAADDLTLRDWHAISPALLPTESDPTSGES